MEINLVVEVIELLLVGMGIVFTFLIIAVFMTQGKILRKFFPQEELSQTINVVLEANATNTDAAKIAAVIAAVQHHKNLKG
ncbi:OadG family protein [Arcobacter caeni]|jgi:oxaloacetate decarboxylase (Na+ extruding) subunit gamma|uniref:Sodium pump decarboxylase subunit gamma n=1 Tax=Arcobacter caeni TaxID=1912877 RepID=A0A363CYV4_9BACT|nr:OadG family transporter subunit [Arcobacter caeni]PUE64285.1 sodium pump decarboxylase subunit gamma [Arcobacter caeni]